VAPSPVPERHLRHLTIRNNTNQQALPMRHLGAFLLGTGVGSGGVHWNGQIWRFLPSDFLTKSHNQQRYGKKASPTTT
jgi:gluconate 2-dehydrogenase alpha chain